MPQRGIGLQPKVGASAPTLGHRESNLLNRNAVVANVVRDGRTGGRNRVAVGNYLRTVAQGSSCLATPGFGTESRWDSQNVVSGDLSHVKREP